MEEEEEESEVEVLENNVPATTDDVTMLNAPEYPENVDVTVNHEQDLNEARQERRSPSPTPRNFLLFLRRSVRQSRFIRTGAGMATSSRFVAQSTRDFLATFSIWRHSSDLSNIPVAGGTVTRRSLVERSTTGDRITLTGSFASSEADRNACERFRIKVFGAT